MTKTAVSSIADTYLPICEFTRSVEMLEDGHRSSAKTKHILALSSKSNGNGSVNGNGNANGISNHFLNGMHSKSRFCPLDGYKFAAGDVSCPSCGTARMVISNGGSDSKTLAGEASKLGLATDHAAPLPFSKKWKKVLWERQDFADDYVDETFLIGLRTNGK